MKTVLQFRFFLLPFFFLFFSNGNEIWAQEEASACDRASDSLELVKLYNATSGPGWKSSWNLNAPINSWFGVFLNGEGCVLGLDFSQNNGNNLAGHLPALNLPNLEFLRLTDNSLTGPVPSFAGMPQLTVLTLDSNNFTGSAENIGVLVNLNRLDIKRNNLTGNVNWLSGLVRLRHLNLSRNSFTGNLNAMEALPDLLVADISENLFTGNLPRIDLSTELEYYNAGYNLLTGVVPAFYGKLDLETLILNNNDLSGFEPDFYFTGPALRQLILNNNRFTSVSSNLSLFNNLSTLSISHNELTSLPDINFPPQFLNFSFDNNSLTFSSVIPNLFKASMSTSYSPQKQFGEREIVSLVIGDPFVIEYEIDQNVIGSIYDWYRDGEFIVSTPVPRLTIMPVSVSDAGDYVVQVSNPSAPQLTLTSWAVTLEVLPSVANDNCINAIEVFDLYNGCYHYTTKNATLDLTTPSCYFTNPANVWFKFRAVTKDLQVVTSSVTGNLDVALIRFNNQPCVFANLTELACSSSILTYNNLTPGVEYYLLVSKGTTVEDDFSLCVNNFVPSPVNDDICNATVLTAGECADGTLQAAGADFGGLLCQDLGQSTVWYKVQMPANTNTLVVDLRNNSFRGPVNVTVFNDRNCLLPPVVNGTNTYCGISDLRLYFNNLEANQFYYVLVSSSIEYAGTFRFCTGALNLNPADCMMNNNCLEARLQQNILNLSADGEKVCLQNCNVLGLPAITNIDPESCLYTPNYGKWYHIIGDSESNVLSVEFEAGNTIQRPRLILLSSDNCSSFTAIACLDSTFTDSIAQFHYPISPGQRLYLLISSDETESGDFEFCIRTFSRPNKCVVSSSILATETSLLSSGFGPFLPGEEVTFCYEIKEWVKYGCSRPQGIVPLFGEGWDPVSFTVKGEPGTVTKELNSYGNGRWFWLETGEVRYNTTSPPFTDYDVFPGQPLRAGWYFREFDPVSGDYLPVSESLGDGGSCLQDTLSWSVCFTLMAKDFGDCESLGANNALVDILTFSDVEIGANRGGGCFTDVRTMFRSSVNCCLSDVIAESATFEVCIGEEFELNLNDFYDSDKTFRWIPVSNPAVGGAEPGSGSILKSDFTILQGDTVTTQTYNVFMVDDLGCRSNISKLNIVIHFNPFSEASAAGEYCEDELVPVMIEGFFSNLPLRVDYRLGGNDSFILLDTANRAVIEMNARDALNFEILSTSNSLCASDEYINRILIDIHEIKETDLFFRECKGTPIFVNGIRYPESGLFYDTLSTSRGCDSILFINVQIDSLVTGDTVRREICFGQSLIYNGIEYSETGMYPDTFHIRNNCDIAYILDVLVYPQMTIAGSLVANDNGTGSGAIDMEVEGGKEPYSYLWSNGRTERVINNLRAGIYTVTVTDALGCTEVFGFNLLLTGLNERDMLALNNVKVYPNPIKNALVLNIEFSHSIAEEIEVFLMNMDGKEITSVSHLSMTGNNKILFEIPATLPAGGYNLVFKSRAGKILVKNIMVN